MIYRSNFNVPLLCPIHFGNIDKNGNTRHYPRAFTYRQKWLSTDAIHIQFQDSVTGLDFTMFCKNQWGTPFGAAVHSTQRSTTTVNVYDITFPMTLVDGVCYFEIYLGDVLVADSTWNEVIDNGDTVLVEVWNSRNEMDVIFDAYQSSNVFYYRFEGGFRPDGFTPRSDLGLFTDQLQQDTLSYAKPFAEHLLSLSDNYGLGWWMVEKLNALFCCDVVLIGGVQYVRTAEDMQVKYNDYLQAHPSIVVKTKSNRFYQNVPGQIFITDRDGRVIMDELNNLFVV